MFHKDKLAELIVFFAEESKDDIQFGSVKLNKLLFLADFWAYGHLGQSITGATYVRQDHGPTPSRTCRLLVRRRSLSPGLRWKH